MARKITGKFAILEITLMPRFVMWKREEAGDVLVEARTLLRPIVAKLLGCEVEWDGHIQTDAVCEFCGYNWTEKSETFNGGCCDKDLEADPEANQVAP